MKYALLLLMLAASSIWAFSGNIVTIGPGGNLIESAPGGVACVSLSDSMSPANSTTITSLFGPTISGTNTIPANFWTVGRTRRIRGQLTYNSKSGVAGGVVLSIKLGSTTVGTGTLTLPSSLVSTINGGMLRANVVCTSVGVLGTVRCSGFVNLSDTTQSVKGVVILNVPAAVIDTTQSMPLDVTFQNTIANVSNFLVCHQIWMD